MSQYKVLYENTRDTVLTLLCQNIQDWPIRYGDYVERLLKAEKHIRSLSKIFGSSPNLTVYLPISKAFSAKSASIDYDVRYKGQSVATMRIHQKSNMAKGVDITLRIKTAKNGQYFKGYPAELSSIKTNQDIDWHSAEARKFRKFFADSTLKGKSLEHNFEAQLLKDFAQAANKNFTRIRPVTVFGKRFQMPTPLSSSKAKDGIVRYAKGTMQGGIDILARHGLGRGVCLTVVELKDACDPQEPPEKAIMQAIAYATFLRTLLRTKEASPTDWWKFFGFSGNKVPDKLKIKAVIAMPTGKYNDTSFAREKITFSTDPVHPDDYIELHYLYFSFDQKNHKITTKSL
jgi:hypothetical protein